MENTIKLKLIEKMMNMSRQGKNQDALELAEQDAYDTDSNLMGADWDSEQDYGVPK